MMDRDYFIKLIFGTHKVADLLQKEGKESAFLKKAANKLLGDLLIICEENPVTLEQKKNILPRTLRSGSEVQALLLGLKQGSKVNPTNFAILEQEYRKLPDTLVAYFASQKAEELTASPSTALRTNPSNALRTSLSVRQEKILEFLKTKEKAQVWELQKMLPEPVTKRTLRRDMDELMRLGKVVREGEWNGVFYKLGLT